MNGMNFGIYGSGDLLFSTGELYKQRHTERLNENTDGFKRNTHKPAHPASSPCENQTPWMFFACSDVRCQCYVPIFQQRSVFHSCPTELQMRCTNQQQQQQQPVKREKRRRLKAFAIRQWKRKNRMCRRCARNKTCAVRLVGVRIVDWKKELLPLYACTIAFWVSIHCRHTDDDGWEKLIWLHGRLGERGRLPMFRYRQKKKKERRKTGEIYFIWNESFDGNWHLYFSMQIIRVRMGFSDMRGEHQARIMKIINQSCTIFFSFDAPWTAFWDSYLAKIER